MAKHLSHSTSGIATFEGPPPNFRVEGLKAEGLEKFLSNLSGEAQPHKILIVKMPDHASLKILRPFREQRCILGINDLPDDVNENFLDHFCKNKTFVLFDFRSEGVIIEQVIDQIVRYTCLLPIVLILVEEGVFGAAVERRLRERSEKE